MMKEYPNALKIVLDSAVVMPSERIYFQESMNRILMEDVLSDINMPPFDKSAMDGFACRREELGCELEIIETIAAGAGPLKSLGKQQCARIMTGAMVPEGADCVFMVEESELTATGQVRFTGKDTKNNIAYLGEDIRKGEVVIQKGSRIKPQHIAIMASVGWIEPQVSKKPQVGIISTGNEIVEPDQIPAKSQIRNSNGFQLVAQVQLAGANANYHGIAADNEEITYQIIKKALEQDDVVLLSGGVSMGAFDFIPKVLERLEIELKFETLALQPGKPTVFGISGNRRVFGLPGNPVSSFNIFKLLVEPLINKMLGEKSPLHKMQLPMGIDFKRRRASRMSWFPVKISEDGKVYPMDYHGSAHIYALAEADAFAAFEINVSALKEGDLVDVRPF